MAKWSEKIEAEITLLIKEWLKHHNKTQKDLRTGLHADSERMPALMEILKTDFSSGGIQKLLDRLCSIEEIWITNPKSEHQPINNPDPFGQLDLLLEELKEDCNN